MKTLSALLIFLCSLSAWASFSFGFDSSEESWGNWGDGMYRRDTSLGYRRNGSLWISTDWGEVHTLNYQWEGLKPGRYILTAYVRAQSVQPHPDKVSFWHFYDSGEGTVSVFEDLNGSYDWRKITYTIEVKDKLSIWFRLKSAGQIWLDDLSLTPTKSRPMKPNIARARPLSQRSLTQNSWPEARKTVLLDFDQFVKPHPFAEAAVNSNKMGKFISHDYFNFVPAKYLNGDWEGYERIAMDVYNPLNESVEFFMTLGDDMSTNYWTHQNHKTSLAPGWNRLDFSLLQLLGERGSNRVWKSLNLRKISKWFIIADPEKKHAQQIPLYLDNLTIYSLPGPKLPAGLTAFDFSTQKIKTLPGFKKVTSQDNYSSYLGYGFENQTFWRVEDAIWAPTLLRTSIGLLKGGFRFKIPNGRYKAQLIIDRLGYWDVSFWQNRTILINGRPVFKESRNHASDFLKDWLAFESIIPGREDHPYDLFLKKVLKPIELEFTVTENNIRLDFEGDATGISLNSLIIWRADAEGAARSFLTSLESWHRQEMDWNSRKVVSRQPVNAPAVAVIEPKLNLSPFVAEASVSNNLSFIQTQDESSYQLLQLFGDGEVEISLKDHAEALSVSEVIPQYASPDLNHETYSLYGKYLKGTRGNKIRLKTGQLSFVWLEFKNKKLPAGTYRTELRIAAPNHQSVLPVSIRVLPERLPKVDFGVGFFGLDPIAYSYFPGNGLEELREQYRYQALNLLGGAGFTSFSGLPEVELVKDGELWRLNSEKLDVLLQVAREAGMQGPFYSYGGQFPQKLLDGSEKPDGMNENIYRSKIAELLSIYLTQPDMPVIVHTFSDEASGYSNRVEEDIVIGRDLKQDFPFLARGGFTGLGEDRVQELNRLFDYPFYSNLTAKEAQQLKGKWGSYNAAAGNLDDPRFTFGPGLFFARKLGINHYLEWHTSSINNYPYFDLDGRESDVMLFLPASDGSLRPTLKFKLAAEGLNAFRKLTLLEKLSRSSSLKAAKEARNWLAAYQQGKFSSENNLLRPVSSFRFEVFKAELNQHLERVSALGIKNQKLGDI